MRLQSPLYVFDACSLLNVIACRRCVEILNATQARFIVPERVAMEVRFVRRGGDGADADEREVIDLKALLEPGILTAVNFSTIEEENDFINLARDMDDGEASACAVAIQRAATLITDDRKARRIMRDQFPSTSLLTTAELIKGWTDTARLEAQAIARVLLDVEQRAHFRPGLNDPLGVWWHTARNRI